MTQEVGCTSADPTALVIVSPVPKNKAPCNSMTRMAPPALSRNCRSGAVRDLRERTSSQR